MHVPLPRERRHVRIAAILAALLAGMLAVPAAEAQSWPWKWPKSGRTDFKVNATPENVILGGIKIDREPVLRIKSGNTVQIDTISHSGATNAAVDPETFFGLFGVPSDQILQDVKDFHASLPTRERYGPHVLTGPIHVEGAEPGDMLEIEIMDIGTRVPYGVNSTGPTSGVFGTGYPGWREGDLPLDIPEAPLGAPGGIFPGVRQHLYRTKKIYNREYGFLTEHLYAPLQPHMGVMGVAPPTGEFVGSTPTSPPPASGVQSSGPPGKFGGNMDIRDLTKGAHLYLPVFQPGALFYTGDPHAGQGNGEVSGTAIEQSLTGKFRFILHKGKAPTLPRIEDKSNYIVMGIDHDLDRAMKIAAGEMVKFLVERGLTTAQAYSLSSVAGDFQVAEVVDGTQIIIGKLDKKIVPPLA